MSNNLGQIANMFKTNSTAFDKASFHETFHVGQMSYLRKWLGYGQAVG